MGKSEQKCILLIMVFVGMIAYSTLAPIDVLTTKAVSGLGVLLLLGLFAEHNSSQEKQ